MRMRARIWPATAPRRVLSVSALGTLAHGGEARARRVAGASLMLLNRGAYAIAERFLQVRLDVAPAVPDHHDDLAAPGFERSTHRIMHERAPCDGVHHFWRRALHARALAGGEDDRRRVRE